ncbi:MAG: hypothetical protein Roseis2KO_56640 [Roseivirga sp.]
MKEFADGVIEDSQRIEELKKAGAIDKPINISEDSAQRIITDSAQVAFHAKEWLTTTIVKFFDQGVHHDIRDITTEQYAAYKQDALCVVYDCDHSLTEEEFKQKWSDTYDISYARFGAGFLIDQQDWYEIVVTKCELTDQSIQGTYIFDTEITDTGFKLTHANEITVLLTDVGFKIDDVKKRK